MSESEKSLQRLRFPEARMWTRMSRRQWRSASKPRARHRGEIGDVEGVGGGAMPAARISRTAVSSRAARAVTTDGGDRAGERPGMIEARAAGRAGHQRDLRRSEKG